VLNGQPVNIAEYVAKALVPSKTSAETTTFANTLSP
jgi:hypothetical protein